MTLTTRTITAIIDILFIILLHCNDAVLTAESTRSLLTDAQTAELQILTALYQSTSGPTWTVSTSWLDEVSYCNWFGVTCNEVNHVSKIELSSNNLRGSVPLRALLRLPFLKVLKIDGNSIDSSLGDGADVKLWEGIVFDDVTSATSSVSSLQYIDLSHTDVLSGQISNIYSPSYIINPEQSSSPVVEKELSYPYLNDLYLSGCSLRSAPIEKEWSKFAALERLVLDDNTMSGTIPPNLQMNNLRVFSANGNKLSGDLDAFGMLDKLRHLSLRNNQFNGPIPSGLRCDGSANTAKLLEILDLSNQSGKNEDGSIGLTGELPSFSQCENLRRLDLSRNSIAGEISADFLQSVDPLVFEGAMLNSNRISGTLPSTLNRFNSDAIAIQGNLISGLDEEILCNSNRNGAIAAFGCDAILCPPGKFYPGTGKQEEAGEECIRCDSSKYWGAILCADDSYDVEPTPPSPPAEATNAGLVIMTEEEQKSILMQLFESTNGQSWMRNSGWVRHDTISICNWFGVECALGTTSVQRLDLQSNNLQGSLPTSVFLLPALKTLILKDNSLFPANADAIDFLSGIDKAAILETLDLSSTGLSTIVGIENASPSLSELHLDSNPLDSTFPAELFSLRSLKMLSMDDCNLSGPIDSTIHQLSNLVLLSASNNRMTGSLPSELSYLTSLSTLRLNNNRLVGTVPITYNQMTALTSLDLSGQKQGNSPGLEGPLREFSEAPNIKRLDLSINSFSGPVPGFFLASVDPDSFEFADLSNNLLVSSFPVGLGSIANKVYLQQNHISSVQEICDLVITGSDLDVIGCDALLCAPGTYNNLGRSTAQDDPCLSCGVEGGAQYFGSVNCDESESSLTSEKQAVELIYSSCNGPQWVSRTSWLSDTISICQWEGITCSDDGSVTDLSLRSNGLICSFPVKEIFIALPALDTLALEGNDVSFDFTIIEGSPALKALDLTNTNAQTLDGIEALFELVELHASSNSITGTFPKNLLQLSSLERLDLSFNNLDGTLPIDFGHFLKKMKFLSMGHNDLSGTLPTSMGEMMSLQVLQIESNKFFGQVPQEVLDLTELQAIDLSNQSGQGLSGMIPTFAAHGLQSLDLSGNAFNGSIPDSFVSITDTTNFYLDVSSNQLTGEIPSWLSRFQVSSLNFADNKITGISAALCGVDCALVLCSPTTYSETGRQPTEDEYCQHCPQAVYWGATVCPGTTPTGSPISFTQGAATVGVDITEDEVDKIKLIYESCGGDAWYHTDNWMSSVSICNWYGIDCVDGSVVSIVLSANNLQGVFPPNIFFLPNLDTLALDSNAIQFNFNAIKYATKLSSFDISDTGLFKLDGIQEAPALTSLDISRNKFTKIPLELFEIRTLQQLDMGGNNFQSELPANIGFLKELKFLSSPSSKLQGSIPVEIGKLTNLVHLNLEDNSLTGSLPKEIEALEALAFLDLSGQSLQYQLPSLATLREMRRLDLSKNSFSGTIPDDFLSSVNPVFFDYLDLSQNYLSGTVPSILHFNTMYLQENQFTAIDSELCDKSRGGIFKLFGCDAILCPLQTYNVIGRQDSEVNPCQYCPSSLYYGATSCNSTESQIPIENLELLPTDIVQEKKGLTILYHKTGGTYWTSNAHWLDDRLSHCHWKGIECHNGTKTVKSIDLGSNNVLGTPPEEVFTLLPNLNKLHLNSNPLTSFNFHFLAKAERLADLNLDAIGLASLNGVESAPSLRRLSLRSNHLSGPFPMEILELKTLTTLILGHNDFTGQMPLRFDKLPYLETLILNDNTFTGDVEDLTFPRTIKLLDLSGNQLSGTVPSTFLQNVPTSVQVVVDLSDNQILAMHQNICTMNNLNRGDVEKYGCSGLLCPIEHYSNTGRQSSLAECTYCPSASYMGATECLENSGSGAAMWAPLVTGLLAVVGVTVIVVRRRHSRDIGEHEDVSLILDPDGSGLDTAGCLA